MPANSKWVALYALIVVLVIIAALTIIILNGRDVNLLVAALIALLPVFAGIGVLIKQGTDVAANTAPSPEKEII